MLRYINSVLSCSPYSSLFNRDDTCCAKNGGEAVSIHQIDAGSEKGRRDDDKGDEEKSSSSRLNGLVGLCSFSSDGDPISRHAHLTCSGGGDLRHTPFLPFHRHLTFYTSSC